MKYETYLNRKVVKQINFPATETFRAVGQANHWAKENGYSTGSMCGDMPIAMFKDASYVAKWKNLSEKEKKQCDGVIISSDFRDGEVNILLFNE